MADAEEQMNLDPNVVALGHDIKTQPDFHERKWREFVEANTSRADFIVRRALLLFNNDAEVVRKVLILFVETRALDEKEEFAALLSRETQLPEIYNSLGKLSVEDQLNALPPELPTQANGRDGSMAA